MADCGVSGGCTLMAVVRRKGRAGVCGDLLRRKEEGSARGDCLLLPPPAVKSELLYCLQSAAAKAMLVASLIKTRQDERNHHEGQD